MHKLLLFICFLFLLGLGNSIYRQDMSNAIFQIVIACILFLLYVVFRRNARKKADFEGWLLTNREQFMMSSELIYDGIRLDKDSELVQYEVCFSFGLISLRSKTRHYIKGYHYTPLLNLMFTAYTFLFGWWALPFGPFYTLRSIGYNLFSKPKLLHTVVGELAVAQAAESKDT
ncbi:hypothetical protein LQV63_20445 [Paenibacillus profundus]|uniref:Uncharacterized protein n=1 Tax=Paenibacillus profundus TaxID=1173085 RepID=A0ABS8YIB9_9BACL|nr:hypothetical protein [Paenibacillus profundus]MCE5171658.1 hypothetical protein [Paenibacillus profundus]